MLDVAEMRREIPSLLANCERLSPSPSRMADIAPPRVNGPPSSVSRNSIADDFRTAERRRRRGKTRHLRGIRDPHGTSERNRRRSRGPDGLLKSDAAVVRQTWVHSSTLGAEETPSFAWPELPFQKVDLDSIVEVIHSSRHRGSAGV